MIKHGVAHVRLSSSANGVATGTALEEFFVVVFEDEVLPRRFKSYAQAMKHCESLWKAGHAAVA